MKVLITGADGFIGKNLSLYLSARGFEVVPFTRETSLLKLKQLLPEVDFIVHLAGVNRPEEPSDFVQGNINLTELLCNALLDDERPLPIIYSSSTQAALDNPYGKSKLGAEQVLEDYTRRSGAAVYLYRLPNVFGKWAKPNYNSVVATFCHNIARDLPIDIHDPKAELRLVYIDDVMGSFYAAMTGAVASGFVEITPTYQTTVGRLAEHIKAFKASRDNLTTENVGAGFVRALYATYVSYLKPKQFSYRVPQHGDERGVFVEILKTKEAGQFSFFTAHPGVTRGGHYHHTKTEKFLVVKGKASFKFRHMVSGEVFELLTDSETPEIVETVPGWTHDVTNVGVDEMVVLLWANEIFDRENPDTYAEPVEKHPSENEF